MPRVVHFEILSPDPERAALFYAEALGWQVSPWNGSEPYSLITTGPDSEPGINGGLMGRHFGQPVINTIQVESLVGTVARIEMAGGKQVHGPNEIPGIGTHVYCTDPDGNLFGVLQPVAS